MPRCCFDWLKSPYLRIPPGSPSSPRLSLYCTSRMRAQQPPPFIHCRVVSRHASGASIGVALAFYISRQCVIFGNRGEREEGARFCFFSRTLTQQLMSFSTNQTPPEVTPGRFGVLYCTRSSLLDFCT